MGKALKREINQQTWAQSGCSMFLSGARGSGLRVPTVKALEDHESRESRLCGRIVHFHLYIDM